MSGLHTLIHMGLVTEASVRKAIATMQQAAKTVEVGPEWSVTVRAVDGGLWAYRVFVHGALYSWSAKRYRTRAAALRAGNADMRFCAALREAVQRA